MTTNTSCQRRHSPGFMSICAALIVLICGCSTSPNPDARSGQVAGHVLVAPTCPVQLVSPGCSPRPVSGASIVVREGTAIRGSAHTDSAGAFHFELPYGRYVVTVTDRGQYASTTTGQVTISGVPAGMTLTLDSGIR
jgi:hypothetical protein